MRSELRAFISLSFAAAIAIGAAGTGCSKKAPPTTTGGETAATQSRAPESVSASDLAKSELARTQPNKAETGANQVASASPQAKTPRAPALPPEPTCYIETFFHKPTPGHTSDEACSHHKNLLKLSHSRINSAHVCVRVNGIPVKFARKGSEILIGAIAGPKAKITVSYCVGKLTCPAVANQNCAIPKDEFMDALAGEGDANTAVQWDSAGAVPNNANTKLNAQVQRELADFDGMSANDKNQGPGHEYIFKGWIRKEDAPACVKKNAS